jgi:hypothetical protein
VSPFFLLWPVTSGVAVVPPPPPPAVDGPWRLLSPEYPKPKKRDVEKIFWPGDAHYPPVAPPAAPGAAPIDLVARPEAPLHDRLAGGLVRPVPRGTDPALAELEAEEEAAIALLLLG